MDKNTRNAIERATQAARRLLEEDFAAQLEGDFDVHRDGAVAVRAGSHLSARQAFQRDCIVAAIEHKRAAGMSPAEAARDYLRDAAFTTLNRFVALKMLETRELVQECISKGEQSGGYREFCGMAPGLPLLPESAGYRLYIESLFDELSTEVKVLFDRRDPSSVLWPKRGTFERLLETLNTAELAGVWGEDETIGWVYQFFNGQDERRKMREESQAPRNSRELAVRNQFFTPRYVVQFLTDNTLGRIWYEMRETKTVLVEQCGYMVGKSGEACAPRPKKDPRDLRVLDPACGSGHFLLYSFDLLLAIYEEAWSDPESPKSEATGRTLAQDYPGLDGLRQAVPGLVLAHNLYGVDIDPRCAQIAQLALWMRAQKAYRDFGITRAQRMNIRRSNIVVAEPLVADEESAKEFLTKLGDTDLSRVFTSLVGSLKLAEDLGLLLRVEGLVKSTRTQGELFAPTEERIRASLVRFAREEAGRASTRRRLFADDAANGLELLAVVERKYDTVLMNPPFGEPTPRTRALLRNAFGKSAGEIGLAFVERASELLTDCGRIGAITSRNFIANDELREWREQILLGPRQRLIALADLGYGVMDDALVFASAYVVGAAGSGSALFFRLLSDAEKGDALLTAITSELPRGVYERRLDSFQCVPGKVLAYHLPPSVLALFDSSETIKSSGGRGAQGLITGDDFRFLRLWWEVPQHRIGAGQQWVFYAKGGEYRPYWDALDLVVNWGTDGREIRNFLSDEGRLRSRPQNTLLYFREGVTYPERTASDFSPRPLPSGCIFSATGQAVFLGDRDAHAVFIAGAFTRPYKMLLEALFASGDTTGGGSPATHYRCGAIELMPLPISTVTAAAKLASHRLIAAACAGSEGEETSYAFQRCLLGLNGGTLSRSLGEVWAEYLDRCERMFADQGIVEAAVAEHLALDGREGNLLLDQVVGTHPSRYPSLSGDQSDDVQASLNLTEAELVAAAVRRHGARRQLTKKSYLVDRRLELMAHALGQSVVSVIGALRGAEPPARWSKERASDVLQFLVGVVFGRHQGKALTQRNDADAFVYATPNLRHFNRDVRPGAVCVDDAGNADDLATAVTTALGGQVPAEAIDGICNEIAAAFDCEGIRDALSMWFFEFHRRRFSGSRRSAPIYWQLATPSAAYSVWLYIHTFSKDTLFRVQNDYVAPRLAHEERRLESLANELRDGATADQRRQLAAQDGLVDELRALLDEVKRVAPLWNPNLDDGVIINFAPLWRLVPQNKTWQKELKSTWDALCEGEYDWAHLAMHLWPERVVPKCAKDRSLAIAHGLEDVLWIEGVDGKWTARRTPTRSVDELVKERTSPAVKSALKSLLEAPVASGKRAGRKGSGRRKAAAAAEGDA